MFHCPKSVVVIKQFSFKLSNVEKKEVENYSCLNQMPTIKMPAEKHLETFCIIITAIILKWGH